jgi:Kef-type K+ transport system membrane component KefB/nucleotide-binding universal stress UspA family protein
VKKIVLPAVMGMICTLQSGAACAAARTGAGNGFGGAGEVVLIVEVVLLLFIGRGLGEIMQRYGQPAVIGNLLAGLILGPSLFGWIWPEAHRLVFPGTPEAKGLIAGVSDMGVLMLLLLTGMETDLKLVRKVGMPAIAVTAAGVAVPFLCGFSVAWFIPDSLLPSGGSRLIAALFLGTALSISSIKIVAMVVREMNFMRRNLGQIIVASAIMEDTVGWVIISITLGIAGAGGFSPASLARTVIGTAAFLAVSYTIGRRLVFWLIRWVNDTFASEYAVVTAILIVMCLMALTTQAIGVNTVLGAFVAGVLVGESPILSDHIQNQLRGFITAFMMPIFFGMSGLSADLTIFRDPRLALLTLGLIGIASIGKFAGAFAGGMASGLSTRESLALGCGMNARGSTEVIVATIGLTLGALTQDLYTMIVTMAVVTTMAMPPMLRWSLRRLPMTGEEKKRLEKEEIDSRGFVAQLERLLITADKSPSGAFATRLAGFVAGQRGLPITVLQLDRKKAAGEPDLPLREIATEGAKGGHRSAKEEKGEERPDPVEVSARSESKIAEAVQKEAPKGYDMLFIGLERMHRPDGTFSAAVGRAANGFDGAMILAIAGENREVASADGLNILVPVNGTEASRRGAEMAFAISPTRTSGVTALHVANRAATNGTKRRRRGVSGRPGIEAAVLKDTTRLAKRYGYERIDTAVHTDAAPEDAILEEAMRRNADVVVIGTSRRVGDGLYLGQTVANLLQKWKGATVLMVSP